MSKLALREETEGRIQVFEWFSKLKINVTSVEDAGCSGHPLMREAGETVDQGKELVTENRRISTLKSCEHVGNFVLVSLEHFERQSECALYCCKICTLSAAKNSSRIVLTHTKAFHKLLTHQV